MDERPLGAFAGPGGPAAGGPPPVCAEPRRRPPVFAHLTAAGGTFGRGGSRALRSLTTQPLAENLPMTFAREAAQPRGFQEMRLRLALDVAGIGVWARDIATGGLDLNVACYRHFGVPVGEKITHDRFLAF